MATHDKDEHKQQEVIEEKQVALPIQWVYPEGQNGLFSNHLIIQFDKSEFHLSFFEIRPVILLGSPDEKLRKLKSLEHVDAQCVARIVVSKERMRDFLQVLQDNVTRHLGEDSDGG